jgi:hypothetical protein
MNVVAWAQAQGLNGFHPGEWPPEAIAAFIHAQLVEFRVTWRRRRENGTVSAYYQTGNRCQLLQRVAQDVHRALAPPPSDTYRICPCHPRQWHGQDDVRSVEERVTAANVATWVSSNPFVREGLSQPTQAAPAYLEMLRGSGT